MVVSCSFVCNRSGNIKVTNDINVGGLERVKFYLSLKTISFKLRPPGFRHNKKTTTTTWPKLDAAKTGLYVADYAATIKYDNYNIITECEMIFMRYMKLLNFLFFV